MVACTDNASQAQPKQSRNQTFAVRLQKLFHHRIYRCINKKTLSNFVTLLADLDLSYLHIVFILSFRTARPEQTA